MASEDVLEWAETSVGLLFDANYSEREALFIQNTIDRLAAEVRELRKDKARLEAGIAAVVNLHGPNHDPDGWAFCNLCRDDFKCPTICALDAAMGGEAQTHD